MHIVLTGVTGLVGSGVLHHILSLTPSKAAAKSLTTLTLLSRRSDIPLLSHSLRPRLNTYTKINVIQHSDFTSVPASLLEQLTSPSSPPPSQISVIWALGISQTLTSSAVEYTEITKTFAVSFARSLAASVASSASPATRVNFVYVSGEGASHSPGLFTPLFGRVKGETELELLGLMEACPLKTSSASGGDGGGETYPNLSVYNVRPGMVDGINQPAVWEESAKSKLRSGLGVRIAEAVVFPIVRAGFLSGSYSPTEELASVFVDLAVGDGGALSGSGCEGWEGRIVRAAGVRRLAKDSESDFQK